VVKKILLPVLLCALAAAQPSGNYADARRAYQSTQYEQAVQLLQGQKDIDSLLLLGQSWFMLGEFKKASEVFEKAVNLSPNSSQLHLWLGRAYGRRAETSSPFFAPRYASKARQQFEAAVELDPHNILAMNDLFEYYMEAPGFLGGGKDKAQALAQRIAGLDPAEGHYAQARLDEDRKQFGAAEEQLRRAVDAAPSQVGRVLDLARFLAKHGRHQESEAAFQRAAEIAPGNPKVLFERAATYIETRRNIDEAKVLLKKYLQSSLTPDDPSREQARKLLREAGS